MAYQSINPNDGKRLKSFEHMSSARIDEVLAAARKPGPHLAAYAAPAVGHTRAQAAGVGSGHRARAALRVVSAPRCRLQGQP